MASGLTPKLPLIRGDVNDFELITSYLDLVKQNFKNVMLTNPGERVMEPEFGVGIRNYLFENFNNTTYKQIDTKIRKQVDMYMPAITINEVSFDGSAQDANLLGIAIIFSIHSIGVRDLLEFTI